MPQARCKLMVIYQGRYEKQWKKLTKETLKWELFFETIVTFPEDFDDFKYNTNFRILGKRRFEINPTFDIKIPKRVKRFRWRIEEYVPIN